MQITFDPSDPADCALVATVLESTTDTAPTPAKKTLAKRTAKKPEPEPEVADGPTLQDCIDRAQVLVGEKKVDLVKSAVKKCGAERVSLMTEPAQFSQFMELVADADAADDADAI